MSIDRLLLLTDYKGRFGSKHNDNPYRSGMDKELLKRYFKEHNIGTRFVPFSKVQFNRTFLQDSIILYTSSEDPGAHYKSYLEDIVYNLSLCGAKLIPPYAFLKAHNNKSFMEMLRVTLDLDLDGKLGSKVFGTMEDFKRDDDRLYNQPSVIKSWEGANSKKVFLGHTEKQLWKRIERISKTFSVRRALKEQARRIKYRGYVKDSNYRNKFIVQNFIPNLTNDWKIYVFGNRFFIFYRPVLKKNKFRASGGGYHNYTYGSDAPKPDGLLDFARSVFSRLNVPNASLDIAFDGDKFYLLEFQAVYFGTAGILSSKDYYIHDETGWHTLENNRDIEEAYVHSIQYYLKNALDVG